MSDYYTGGYTCGVCGAFVMHDTIHVCVGPSNYPPMIPAPASQNDEVINKLNEIIELLKEIKRRK